MEGYQELKNQNVIIKLNIVTTIKIQWENIIENAEYSQVLRGHDLEEQRQPNQLVQPVGKWQKPIPRVRAMTGDWYPATKEPNSTNKTCLLRIKNCLDIDHPMIFVF